MSVLKPPVWRREEETKYRNKILDDLYEVKAFLNQRLMELRNEDTLSLQHHAQPVAPLVLQQYSPESSSQWWLISTWPSHCLQTGYLGI
ncbi:hypothetical protein F2Q69_00000277 [Brassica cretica]|uniref:Uncharacterized protein n=1 Tax=Brassica cretica TaxID=69181 RepID=A0A8S9NXE5_BRACR|nr:hypothetical protein F2Q69_00000277 [Brassica cretica]